MRSFNTAGPVVPSRHYCIAPLDRLDLDEVLDLVREQKYFVLHAPRQTGKTSTLLALRDLLNGGDYRCVYASVEAAQAAGDDIQEATRAILAQLASWARETLRDPFLPSAWPQLFAEFGASAFGEVLVRWAEADPEPLVLILDDLDALPSRSLQSIMWQLRAGHVRRPDRFPHSIVLCGMRDVSMHSVATGTPFNFVSESLYLDDFSEAQVVKLLAQHTRETDQAFSTAALRLIWALTQGQPWLVNALAHEACFRGVSGQVSDGIVNEATIQKAKERVIATQRAALHRQVADSLGRAREAIGPLSRDEGRWRSEDGDIDYVRGLGLASRDAALRMANPIYAEVLRRHPGLMVQEELDP